MNVFFVGRGTCTMGTARRAEDGTIVESTPAQFTFDETGGSVAIGELDPETMEPRGEINHLYGDWDAVGYLGTVIELLKPTRPINIPNFKTITQAAMKNGVDLCVYCPSLACGDCILREWKEETEP
jgi:ferredoxin